MINILKEGKTRKKSKNYIYIYTHECTTCGCVFKFEVEDINHNLYGDSSIKCPCCKCHLGISLNITPKRIEVVK